MGGGFLAGEPTEAVEGVDAVVEHGTASAKSFGQAPLAGAHVGAVVGVHGLDEAEFATADDFDRLQMNRLVVQAVGDHQLNAGCFAGVDHADALRGTDIHGLLAEDVLAGLGGANGVFRVHAVG